MRLDCGCESTVGHADACVQRLRERLAVAERERDEWKGAYLTTHPLACPCFVCKATEALKRALAASTARVAELTRERDEARAVETKVAHGF